MNSPAELQSKPDILPKYMFELSARSQRILQAIPNLEDQKYLKPEEDKEEPQKTLLKIPNSKPIPQINK